MALEQNQFENHGNLAQFLEKFSANNSFSVQNTESEFVNLNSSAVVQPNVYEKTFEKLASKIQDLEKRFELTTGQNQRILAELASTRQAMEQQKTRDAFLEHIAVTISNLKSSVEKLSQTQNEHSQHFANFVVQRSFDKEPNQPILNASAIELQKDKQEKERIISSLHQKASQLKAVNQALDREIKKVQQEKIEALRKSAEQAKEILELKEQLNAAEERFKAFDFEGRIISIKKEYQQKVTSLENQLQEMSATCMKQVEEIESLRAENEKLQRVALEKEALVKQLAAKEQELLALKKEMNSLQESYGEHSKKQLAVFSERFRSLEKQRDDISVQLKSATELVNRVQKEKDVLEQNFKELVDKINGNDVVIAQLKQKIMVLSQQNAELTHRNEDLQTEKEMLVKSQQDNSARSAMIAEEHERVLAQADALANQNKNLMLEKNALNAQVSSLTKQKQVAEEQVKHLNQDRANLLQDVENLNEKNKQLYTQAQSLSEQASTLKKQKDILHAEKQTLSQENQQLRNQSATLLTARLVQQKEKAEKEAALQKVNASKSAPKADLPEIRVAEPIPQEESLFDGEDFLEKTDSFIGRIKWSVFKEDR